MSNVINSMVGEAQQASVVAGQILDVLVANKPYKWVPFGIVVRVDELMKAVDCKNASFD